MNLDRIMRHSAAYLVATGLQRGLPILILPIAALFLSSEDIGMVGIGAVVAGGVALISTFGFNVAVVRFVPRAPADSSEKDHSPERWSSIFVVQLVWAVVVGLIGLLIVNLTEGFLSTVAWNGIITPAIFLGVAGSVLQMALGAYRSREHPRGYVTLAAGVFVLSFPLALAGAASSGATGYLIGLAIGSAIPGLVGIGVAISKPSFDRDFTVRTVGLAGPFMVHWAATWVLVGFDRFVIEESLGLDATAIFYVAFIYASIPLLVAEAFGTAWVPAFINRSVDEGSIMRHTSTVVSLALTGLVLVGIGGAVPALPILYPDIGHEAVVLLAVLAPIAIIRVPHIVASALLIDEHRTGLLGVSSIVAAALDVVVVIATIGAFGLAGSAWAKTGAYALASIWVWWAAVRRQDRVAGAVVVATGLFVALTAALFVEWGYGQSLEFLVALVLFAAGTGLLVSGYLRYRRVLADGTMKEAEGRSPS